MCGGEKNGLVIIRMSSLWPPPNRPATQVCIQLDQPANMAPTEDAAIAKPRMSGAGGMATRLSSVGSGERATLAEQAIVVCKLRREFLEDREGEGQVIRGFGVGLARSSERRGRGKVELSDNLVTSCYLTHRKRDDARKDVRGADVRGGVFEVLRYQNVHVCA
ncbi:hypothetical protein H4582DRAFT_1966080 [Lactarius indigo]|nr:hypothetical protein H4582DRAFT_1966080 [Lactarius indigo]